MGLLDGLIGQQSGLLGELPPWMQLRSGSSPVLPDWLKQISMFPPQAPAQAQDATLPPNARPAMLSPQVDVHPQEQRQSIWTPPDSFPGSPPVNPNAPAMPQPGMNAMAQAPMPRAPQAPPLGAPSSPQSITGGIGNAFSGLLDMFAGGSARKASTADALTRLGLDPSIAQAAARDRSLMALIAPAIGAKPELRETGSDPISGQKSFGVWDPRTSSLRPVNGSGSGGVQPVAPASLLSQGVPAINHNLSGDAYLAQFSPEVQSAVKAYINGDVMPSGNPRMQGIASIAKTIAQKYGQDMGIPVSDSLYSQRRTYRSQLGSNSPSSSGGQAKAFNQGIEHMAALAEQLEKLDNSNGFGIPILASAINAVRQETSTDQAAIAAHAANIGQTLAGEVGKLFAGTAGGGVHERQLTRERFDTVKSKPQLAAALEATLETMRGGLTALEQRRDEVLGPDSNVRFVNDDTKAKIAKIEEIIARLKGQAPDAPAAQATAPVAPKIDEVRDGWRFRGGDPADKKNWAQVAR